MVLSFSIGGDCCESKQMGVGSWRTKKCIQIDHEIGRQCSGTGSMKDGKPGIIVHDQGVFRQGFRAVRAPFRKALNPCRDSVFIVHNEHLAVSYTNPFALLLNESTLLQNSVRIGFAFDKLVRQLALPNDVQ